MDLYGNQGGIACCEEVNKTLRAVNRNPTLTETLRARKEDLEARLKEITDALDALEKNPAVEGVLNLVARIR